MGNWILKTLVRGCGDARNVSNILLKSKPGEFSKTWKPDLVWAAEAVWGVGPTFINAIGRVAMAQDVDEVKIGVAMLGRADDEKVKEIRAWLDSGANETMFRE